MGEGGEGGVAAQAIISVVICLNTVSLSYLANPHLNIFLVFFRLINSVSCFFLLSRSFRSICFSSDVRHDSTQVTNRHESQIYNKVLFMPTCEGPALTRILETYFTFAEPFCKE